MKIKVKEDLRIGEMVVPAGTQDLDVHTAMQIYAAGYVLKIADKDEKVLVKKLKEAKEVKLRKEKQALAIESTEKVEEPVKRSRKSKK